MQAKDRSRNMVMQVSQDGKELLIRVDLTQKGSLSSSGENFIIATSGGNLPIGVQDMTILLNVLKPAITREQKRAIDALVKAGFSKEEAQRMVTGK